MDVRGGWPRNTKDRLIEAYHRAHGGALYLEVRVAGLDSPGNWPPGSVERIIDGVVVLGEEKNEPVLWNSVRDDFESVVAGKTAYILEARKRLHRSLIGQVVVGVDMFKRSYPSVGSLHGVAVAWSTDPAMVWWCENHNVGVWSPPRPRDSSA